MGQLFSDLTRSGVQSPNGQTTYQNNDSQTAKLLASASARTAQPGTSTVDGTIGTPTITSTQPAPVPEGGYGPVQDNIDTVTPGQDRTTVGTSDAPIGAQPRLVHPSWSQANAAQDPGSEMTTKGKMLSLIITGMQGAANGMAAGVPTNPHISPGIGPSLAAGFNTPFMEKQKQNALAQEQLAQEKERAQIAALPQQAQAELRRTNAQTDYYQAGSDRREHFQVPGVGLVDDQGKVIVAAPDAGDKQTAALDARKQQAQAAGMDPEQTLQFVYGIKPTKDQVNEFAGYVAKAGGDVSKAVDLKRQADYNDKVAFHTAIQKETNVDAGLSAGQKRALTTDAAWTNITRRMNALTQQYARVATFDPEGAQALSQQIDSLAAQAENRKQQIIDGGKLRLRGARNTSSTNTPKPLDAATALTYLRQAGGDKNKARKLATADGYSF